MPNLSVVINTKNSAQTLERALKSVTFADEIVIVDMESSDTTVELSKKYTSKIFSFKDVGYVEPARNFAINKATGNWILILDADEEVTESLATHLTQMASNTTASAEAYFLPRKNIIFNHWIEHNGWWPDYQLRFFKKGVVEWSDTIHSTPEIKGNTEHLPVDSNYAIIHHNYQSVEQFVERLNRYTKIEAGSSKNIPSINSGESIFKSFSADFLRRFFAEEGYKDGTHGMALSILQSFYQTTAVLKKWDEAGFKNSNSKVNQDLMVDAVAEFTKECRYWIADYKAKNSQGLIKVWWALRRKFKV